MAVRRESVELSLTGDFTSGMVQATAATMALHAQINRLNGQNIRISTNVNSQMASMSRQANQTGDSINQLTGRLGLFADAALILGPGLIPMGAVGGQALMGMVNAAGALAVAGASAVAAFQGLGDAVKAVDAYQLEPTAENLEKAQQAMDKLGPQAREFVMAFQEFQPVLTGIRDAAAAGWFPGLTDSLDDFEKIAPLVERIFNQAGTAGGNIVADTADSLDSKRWKPFMRFIADEAPAAMYSLARIMGDLSHGVAEMWMSFDPGNDDFLGWLEDVADGFDSWASSANGREDIEGFLAYARQNGPAVQELFTSLVRAFGAIVQAAAPLGGPVLQGLTAIANVVETIASSDMGTPILAGAAALRIFNRLAAVTAATQTRMAATGMMGGAAGVIGRPGSAPGIGPLTQSQAAFVAAQQRAQAQAAAAARRAMMAKGAGLAAGGAFLLSGAAENANMTNTAMLTLIGTMAGPFGAAAGAAAGAMMDISAANDAAEQSLAAVQQAIDRSDFAGMTDGLKAARAEVQALGEDYSSMSSLSDPLATFRTGIGAIQGILGESPAEAAAKEYERLEERAQQAREATASLGEAMGMTVGPVDGSARSIKELNEIVEAATPAMEALGITTADYAAAAARDEIAGSKAKYGDGKKGFNQAAIDAMGGAGDNVDKLNNRVVEQATLMDSAGYATGEYVAALRGLGEAATTAAQEAESLGAALDALLDPTLDAEEAAANYQAALDNLSGLDVGAGFQDEGPKGRENLALTRAVTEAMKERLTTMANAKASEADMARAVSDSRRQFIESGQAAGFSAKQMRARADAIGLTPKLVQTTFKALGITKVDLAVDTLRRKITDMPKDKATAFRAEGIPKTAGEVDRLVAKYKLTEQQRQALITLIDRASPGINNVRGLLASVNSKTITLTTVMRTVRSISPFADGGPVVGPGGPRDDKIPAMLSNGEYVINAAATAKNLDLLHAINAEKFAIGGFVGARKYADGGRVRPGRGRDDDGMDHFIAAVNDVTGSLKGLKDRIRDSERALQKETARRSAAASLKGEVAGSLAGDLFGNGLAGLDTGLAANKNDAKAMLAALRKARSKGLDGPLLNLLAASGDLNTVQQFANLSRAQIRQREEQYGSTMRAQNNLGDFAVQAKFGKSIDRMDGTIDRLNGTLREQNKRLRELEKIADRVEKGSEKGTRAGFNAVGRNASQRGKANR